MKQTYKVKETGPDREKDGRKGERDNVIGRRDV
jgi:hypothetical protein